MSKKNKDSQTPEKKPVDLTKAKVATFGNINGAAGNGKFERQMQEVKAEKWLEKEIRKQKLDIKSAKTEIARFDNLDNKCHRIRARA